MTDVCLLVEGAYPYVTGGVSNWLHALVSNLSELTFTIVHIGARPDADRRLLYTLPANVLKFHEIFLNDSALVKKRQRTVHTPEAWQDFQVFHADIAGGQPCAMDRLCSMLARPGLSGLSVADLLSARETWDTLVKLYSSSAPQASFVDFFWTFRLTYLPIFRVLEATLPPAGLYHAVSTGYSGLLGVLAKIRSGRPLIVTEHGLYTREREIEIAQSPWLSQLTTAPCPRGQRLGFFQQWWLNIYRFMERVTYELADLLISITGVNREYQLKRGAEARKLRVIPNGIDSQWLAHLPEREAAAGFRVGFIGRIVPIKDVKTFLHAIKLAHQTIPGLEAYLVGPTSEDAQYFQECRQLVALLELDSLVHFTGPADVRLYYQMLDVVVLTSLSEGQPLVILEAYCARLPVIATDVGACAELVQGVSPQDRALGASGLITPVASPAQTAQALIQLWGDGDARQSMGAAGQQRVRRFYTQEKLYREYTELYRCYLARGEQVLSPS
ncbi:MAG TPA: GT4 family glycosyltransferase PelF [Ktedonobacteraceae bacterium]|jgi:glycosyltransferase involved in cell wall biosynthesis